MTGSRYQVSSHLDWFIAARQINIRRIATASTDEERGRILTDLEQLARGSVTAMEDLTRRNLAVRATFLQPRKIGVWGQTKFYRLGNLEKEKQILSKLISAHLHSLMVVWRELWIL